MPDRNASEIARETLKLLTSRRLVPSPENYQALWHEISGTRVPAPFPDEHLQRIAEALPAQQVGQAEALAELQRAVAARNWIAVQKALVAYASLANSALSSAPDRPPALPPGITQPLFSGELREQIARLIDAVLPAVGGDDSRIVAQANDLSAYLRQSAPEAAVLKSMLGNFSFRLDFVAEEQATVRQTLLELLQLIFRNIAELSVDDRWLSGQVEALMAAATPPVTVRRLDELQLRLKDVIFKQSQAKDRQLQAQGEMKQLLATFVERLSSMTDASSLYQGKIENCARQIEEAKHLDDIAPALQEALGATRAMAKEAGFARDELRQLRERTTQAEQEVHRLQQELDRASTQARHDPLTGVLNRKGMEETLMREVASAKRRDLPLCVALLDIDNFKRINDTLGHSAGDAALVHLADVARSCLRPQDSLSRFGGEEFVILMPDTTLDQGIEAMTRLQRELTKRYFLRDNEKLLITFSAGVTQLAATEQSSDALRRADEAMYLAKRAGKNRVMGG
jgi:diguanylate cyclase